MTFGEDRETLVAAAYFHDIGYAPELAKTGFHPLDGARFIRERGHERLARLVAHHSGARIEAQLRGITDYLDEFPFDDSDLDARPPPVSAQVRDLRTLLRSQSRRGDSNPQPPVYKAVWAISALCRNRPE
jgi:hypothetical protein